MIELDENGQMALAEMIAEIEANKGSARMEYDDLKESYLSGRYRAAGYTKREAEDKLHRVNGEIIGCELALSTLYKRVRA